MSDLENVIKIISSENNSFDAGVFSLIGTREYQQDYAGLMVKENGISGIICDGMGGLNGGERASSEAVKLFAFDYMKMEGGSPVSEFFYQEADKMDRLVSLLKDSKGNFLRAGSTVVSVIIEESRLHWMSVGDSRIYILRGDSILQVTKEHNYKFQLNEALESGNISAEKYAAEMSGGQAEALTSYLGMGGLKYIDINPNPFQLEADDVILLCSDGLYRSLDESQIMAMLKDNKINSGVSAKRLSCMALEQASKGQDNTTVLVIHYKGGEERRENSALL